MSDFRDWDLMDRCDNCGADAQVPCPPTRRRATSGETRTRPHPGRPRRRIEIPLPFGIRYRPCGVCRELVISCPHTTVIDRQAILAEADGACRYCTAVSRARADILAPDHVVPRLRFNVPWLLNAVAACPPCVRAKGEHSLEEWVLTGEAPQAASDLWQARRDAGLPV